MLHILTRELAFCMPCFTILASSGSSGFTRCAVMLTPVAATASTAAPSWPTCTYANF